MYRFLPACLLLAVVAPVSVSAQSSPENLAARCVAELEEIRQRNEIAAADQTEACVRTINALQAQGRDEAAIQVARQCVSAARERTEDAASLANRICNACVDQLLSLGYPDLARRVNHKCDSVLENLRSVLQRQIFAIKQALED